nr:tape measure protein [uncultured Oscillibacter sp.]
MADNNVSIVMTMKTDIDAKLKTIASTSQGCSKAFEEFQRRAGELSGKLDALNKKYDSFNQKSASAKAEAEKLKLEMSAMTKAARASGEGLDSVSYEKLRQEYQRLTDEAKDFASAAKDVRKEIRLTEEDARKLTFTEPDEGMGSSSGGFMSKLFGKDIGGKLAQSGLLQMMGDSASNAIGVFAESALGQPLASAMSETLSGTISGAAAGAIAGIPGMIAGGVIGTISGALNAGTQIAGEQDEAFKDYYRGLYEDVNTATAEGLSSGSTLAAGRETTKLSFNTLLGDSKKAGAFLEQVQDTANTTPFLYDDLVGISKTMLSFGTAVDDIIPTLTKVGDAGAALGLSTGDIGTVATYLGRMQSSDKATLEYLNPLNERGFSVFQWLADDQGVSVGDVYGQISKGELSGSYVSEVILAQFEKLYAGMMEVQSKSTEGLDSTLQGLKENVDAAGGDAYNEARKESKEADIAAYGGYLGDKLAELAAIGGEVQAYGENLKEQFQREALAAVLTGTLDKESTVFSEEDAAKLEGLSQQFSEAEQAYKDGSLEAGQKMVDLREEAEALATAAYESSEWAQKQVDMEIEQIDATRELTAAMASATDAWRTNNAFSKGGAAGSAFTVTTTVDEQTGLVSYTDKYGQSVDPMLVDPGGAGGWAGAEKSRKNRPGYAYGLDYVPYDDFPALLHQGERVLTAAEARGMDRLPFFPGLESLGSDKGWFLDNWADGSFAFGLTAAPYDNFPALLHQGERVEPPPEHRGGGDVQVTVHVDSIVVQGGDRDAADQIAETLAQKLRAAMLRGGG